GARLSALRRRSDVVDRSGAGAAQAQAAAILNEIEVENRSKIMTHLPSLDRRQLLSTAAVGIAVAAIGVFPASAAEAPASDAIRPFRVNIPEADLVDLK